MGSQRRKSKRRLRLLMAVQARRSGPIVRRFGERRAPLLGLDCGATGFLIFGVVPTGPLFWLGIPVMALWGVSGSAIQALLTQSALLIAARTLAIARVADISS